MGRILYVSPSCKEIEKEGRTRGWGAGGGESLSGKRRPQPYTRRKFFHSSAGFMYNMPAYHPFAKEKKNFCISSTFLGRGGFPPLYIRSFLYRLLSSDRKEHKIFLPFPNFDWVCFWVGEYDRVWGFFFGPFLVGGGWGLVVGFAWGRGWWGFVKDISAILEILLKSSTLRQYLAADFKS